MKMAFGNGLGFAFDSGLSLEDIFAYRYGAFLLELASDEDIGLNMGRVLGEPEFIYKGELLALDRVLAIYENKLESVYSCNIPEENVGAELFSFQAESRPAPAIKCARPRVLIPVFPGTN